MATFINILLFAVVAVVAIPDIQYDLEKAEELFENFIQEYGKKYPNADVKAQKFKVFKGWLKVYNKKNLEELNAQFGIHEYSDLTKEQFMSFRGGYRRMSDSACTYSKVPAVNPPEAYDWELQGSAVTSVKQQLCLDCYAFATTANIEGQYAKKYGKLVDLSEQQIVDCDKKNFGCDGGHLSVVFQQIMEIGGQMTLKDYPYKGKEETCSFNASEVQVKLTGCNIYKELTEDDLVKVLYNQGPLAIGLDCNDLYGYSSGILCRCELNDCNHGVLLVGYGVENNTKFWRMKNSWGTKFGEDGYFRVERGTDRCGLMDCEITSATIE